MDYAPFGAEIPRTDDCYVSSAEVMQKFTGQQLDAESALYYFGARQFAWEQGRFVSPDPENAGADPAVPGSWNMFAYAYNNPLMYTDPTGMCGEVDPETGEDREAPWCKIYDLMRSRSLLDSLRRGGERVLKSLQDFRRSPNCVGTFRAIGQTTGAVGVGYYSAQAGVLVGGALGVPTGPGAVATAAAGGVLFGTAGAAVGYWTGGGIGTGFGNLICSSGTGTGGRGGNNADSQSTGRATPANLKEQLAMEQAKANPAAGVPLPMRKGMTDPRWPASQGWVKMGQNINGIEIHYVRNKFTGAVADFKFI